MWSVTLLFSCLYEYKKFEGQLAKTQLTLVENDAIIITLHNNNQLKDNTKLNNPPIPLKYCINSVFQAKKKTVL